MSHRLARGLVCFALAALLAALPGSPNNVQQVYAQPAPLHSFAPALALPAQEIGSEWQTFIPGVGGPVLALASDGANIYVGGHFSRAGGVLANNIARWSIATGQWSALGSGMAGPGNFTVVNAIAIVGQDVYMGGDFTSAGGVSANYVARWDSAALSWHSLGAGVTNGVDRPVQTLLASAGVLYVGGSFANAGGAPARGIAQWSFGGQTWSTVGSGTENGVHGYVYGLALSGSDLYVGGAFDHAGSLATVNVARWNTTSGSWFGLGGGTDNNLSYVQAVVVNGATVIIGGTFATVSDGSTTTPASNIATWNTTNHTWAALGSGVTGGTFTYISAIAYGPNGLYATGSFAQAGATPAANVARWNGSQWSALKNPDESTDGIDNSGSALLVLGSDVYTGGSFANAGIRSALNVVRWNDPSQSWLALGNGVNSYLTALAVDGDDVYLGGDFTSAGGLPAGHVARWNRRTNAWSNLGGGMSGCRQTGSTCLAPTINAILVNGNDVFFAGDFSAAGGAAANSLARWDKLANHWSALGSGVDCATLNCRPEVFALFANSGGLYAGGSFDSAGGGAANNVARWNGSGWASLNGPGNGVNGIVLALTGGSGKIYLGGSFTSPAAYLASFDGNSWASVGSSALNSSVRALAFSGSNLYVGGQFTNAGGSGADYVAFLSNASGAWQALNGKLNNPVYALAVQGSRVIAGGTFTQAGVQAANHIASWDTTLSVWDLFNYGLDQVVRALAADATDLFVGGDFNQTDGLPGFYFTRWGKGAAGVGGFSASDPDCVGMYGNYIGCVVRGADNHVWLKEYINGAWTQWIRINVDQGQTLLSGPSITAWGVQTPGGRPTRLNIFARADTDYVLQTHWDPASGWSAWRWYPGAPLASSDLDCVSWTEGRFDCFYLDANASIATLWSTEPPLTTIYGFGGLGGTFHSAPGSSSWGVGRYDVFGQGTDDELYHGYFETAWSGYVDHFSGKVTSAPDCTSRGDHLIDCAVRGPNHEALLLSYTGTGWTSYANLGGVLLSGPSMATLGASNLNAFVWGTDCHFYQDIWSSGAGWSGWQDLGSDARVTGLCGQTFLPALER